ncbi:hypothetical protein [Blattabacterium cuenoti]|uniref:hypothetical protein n=1 Tax=Blattabacterium cuenoti TaxID=1653831 RepID=UPI00163CF046|nr:hypothetical protein [Blattabacterium cuenoti]
MKISTKIIYLLIFFLISIYCFYIQKKWYGIILLLISLIIMFFIFKNEFLLMAFFKIQKKNILGMKKYLKYITNPEKQLIKYQIPYYYFLYGILYSESDIYKSEKYMQKSLDMGLRFKHNIAIAKLNLAIASISKGNNQKAKLLLLEAEKIDIYGILHNQIKFIKTKLKQSHNINKTNPYFRK